MVKKLTIIVQKSFAEEACKLFSILGGQYGLIIISSGAEEEGKPFNMSLSVERFWCFWWDDFLGFTEEIHIIVIADNALMKGELME